MRKQLHAYFTIYEANNVNYVENCVTIKKKLNLRMRQVN